MHSYIRPSSTRQGRPSLVRFPGTRGRCFLDYTAHLESLIRSWCQRYPQLGHIDMDKVIVSVARCRSRRGDGVYATITSLRYRRGLASQAGHSSIKRVPPVFKKDREALYLIRFFLPRFHDLPTAQKVATILHELFHIHPECNGEFRNFGGTRWAHGGSQKGFEMMFEPLRKDITAAPDPLYELFLDCSWRSLLKRFESVYGSRCSAKALFCGGTQTLAV